MFEKVIPQSTKKKEHHRPHAAAPANNDWLDFPVE